jgi:methyl coenzyme M reductase gamma subunit
MTTKPKTAEEIHKLKMIEADQCDEETYNKWVDLELDAFDATILAMQEFADEQVKAKTLEMQKEIESLQMNYAKILSQQKETIENLQSQLSNQSKMLKDMAEALEKAEVVIRTTFDKMDATTYQYSKDVVQANLNYKQYIDK